MNAYPKRLIEVDLPIKRISVHARREKNIRQGHISTLHIWWARRPLAACRAVICASLWPDPADVKCPESFRAIAREEMRKWVGDNISLTSEESFQRLLKVQKNPTRLDNNVELRILLLDFIADFANWDNSTVKQYLDTSRALTQAAHEALGGAPGTRPLVVDPFAGGGSIPLEALRVGADSFSSDLNPVAVLLNKVVLEYIPKYGKRLAEEVRKWGVWIKEEVEKELAELYPKDLDGSMPIAYLWARTIKCEGPGCGAEIPLMRSQWLAKKGSRPTALRLVLDKGRKQIDFEIVQDAKGGEFGKGTVRRSGATCPICGFTTAGESVRKQFIKRQGGANDARLIVVVLVRAGRQGRIFRLANATDVATFRVAALKLKDAESKHAKPLSLVPDEVLPYLRSIFNIQLLGVNCWANLFNSRQLLVLSTFVKYVREVHGQIDKSGDSELTKATITCLALTLSKLTDLANSLCAWEPNVVTVQHLFGRQAMGIVWDYAEGNPIGDSRGSWNIYLSNTVNILSLYSNLWNKGQVERLSATDLSLPDDSVNLFMTDPPYYDAVPYADLSDFFYVWLKRVLDETHADLFSTELTPKEQEVVQLSERNPIYSYKTKENFERLMRIAMSEGRRVLEPNGIGVVVFAHKSTSGWETQIQAMLSAGWVVVASWPIDTELATRLRGMDSAVLASSVHLVLRPRENSDGSLLTDEIGDWRDVLQELPKRMHEWMPRLAEEGVVGADAIFACLGPALEIFSRYSRVEKMSGEIVTLSEYLAEVWAAVAKEALTMIFSGADVTGFEEDARLTAMWLWTLRTGDSDGKGNGKHDNVESDSDGSETGAKTKTLTGFSLEYDAARKISQGLGAHLENLGHLVTVQGETAVLLPVAARSHYLFGKDADEAPKAKTKKKSQQMTFDFLGDLRQIEKQTSDWTGELKGKPGRTVLDQVHQCMILFAASRTEAMKRLLVEEGIGRNPMFWRLAQALSALYPSNTDEKRWVDGVLARKKGLGF